MLRHTLLFLGLIFPELFHCFIPLKANYFRSEAGNSKMSMSNSKKEIIAENVKGVIFDIDGTLADSWKLGYNATQAVLKNHNIPEISEDEYHHHCRYCTPDRLARHAGLDPSDPNFGDVGNKLAAEFDELYVDLVNTETAGFYSGVEDLLNSFPDSIVYGALTNACVAYAHAVLKSNSEELYKKRFLSVRGADNVPSPKPAPDGLLQVCKDLSLKPENCIYIGDSPSDGEAAAAAGMPSIGVLWGSNSKEILERAPFSKLCSTVVELQSALQSVCVC